MQVSASEKGQPEEQERPEVVHRAIGTGKRIEDLLRLIGRVVTKYHRCVFMEFRDVGDVDAEKVAVNHCVAADDRHMAHRLVQHMLDSPREQRLSHSENDLHYTRYLWANRLRLTETFVPPTDV